MPGIEAAGTAYAAPAGSGLAGLVETHKEGQRVLYRARDSHVRNLIAEALSHADHET